MNPNLKPPLNIQQDDYSGVIHTHLDPRGVAWIDRTNVKVVEVVLDKLAHSLTPDEIHEQHPHLSLAQIHAAFAYYYDHQAEVDAYIERQYQDAETMRTQADHHPTRHELEVRLNKLRQKMA